MASREEGRKQRNRRRRACALLYFGWEWEMRRSKGRVGRITKWYSFKNWKRIAPGGRSYYLSLEPRATSHQGPETDSRIPSPCGASSGRVKKEQKNSLHYTYCYSHHDHRPAVCNRVPQARQDSPPKGRRGSGPAQIPLQDPWIAEDGTDGHKTCCIVCLSASLTLSALEGQRLEWPLVASGGP